jgi:hypothetical protein
VRSVVPAHLRCRSVRGRPRYAGRNSRTRSLNTVIARVHPTRSAITPAGIVGTSVSWARIASSNTSTADPAGFRTYFGGSSLANAARTVLREIFNVLTINIGNPSARCNLRISAQSSTASNSLLLSARKPRLRRRGSKFGRRHGASFQTTRTPLIVSASALSYELPTAPTEGWITRRPRSAQPKRAPSRRGRRPRNRAPGYRPTSSMNTEGLRRRGCERGLQRQSSRHKVASR